jgi:hypothetical protein
MQEPNDPMLRFASKCVPVMLRVEQVMLLFFQLVGVFMACMVTWYYFFAHPLQLADPQDGPAASWQTKAYMVGFVLCWNVFIFFMVRENKKKLRQMKEQKAAEQDGEADS